MLITVIGAGGVGACFGGRLAESGQDVAFIARGDHLRALRERGLQVTSIAGDLALRPVRVSTPPT
jgi:2-dehydropantoate 2-reductase